MIRHSISHNRIFQSNNWSLIIAWKIWILVQSIFKNLLVLPFFPNQVTLHYFGSYNWTTCTARFGQLNDLYQDLINDGYYDEVKLVGIGKSQFGNYVNNWTNGNDASVCLDESLISVGLRSGRSPCIFDYVCSIWFGGPGRWRL